MSKGIIRSNCGYNTCCGGTFSTMDNSLTILLVMYKSLNLSEEYISFSYLSYIKVQRALVRTQVQLLIR